MREMIEFFDRAPGMGTESQETYLASEAARTSVCARTRRSVARAAERRLMKRDWGPMKIGLSSRENALTP